MNLQVKPHKIKVAYQPNTCPALNSLYLSEIFVQLNGHCKTMKCCLRFYTYILYITFYAPIHEKQKQTKAFERTEARRSICFQAFHDFSALYAFCSFSLPNILLSSLLLQMLYYTYTYTCLQI